MPGLEPAITGTIKVRDDRSLFFGEWPGEGPTFMFAPGLTSTHRAIAATARELDGALNIVGLDLLGRGNSDGVPTDDEPVGGMDRHATDVLAVMDALEIERAVVGGHSMGAYVATAVAVQAPDRVSGLVLLDGGVYAVPPGMEDVEIDPDAMAKAIVGPILDQLEMTFPSVGAAVDHWRSMSHWDDHWDEIIESYSIYALERRGAVYAAKCSPQAAIDDWRDLLVNPDTGPRLDKVSCPVLAVGAEQGIEPGTVSILSDFHVERLKQQVPDVSFIRVPGTTHHTVLLSAEGAKATAAALGDFVKTLDA